MRFVALRIGPVLCAAAVAAAPLRGQSTAEADSAWVSGDHALAGRLYALRLATDPNDPTALFRLALLAGWQGRRAESIDLLDRLLIIWPRDNDARAARARMLFAQGRHREAEAAVDTILQINPDDLGGLQTRARFVGYQGRLIESEALWRDVLEREPANTESRVGLAQVLRWQGRFAAAAEVLAPVRERASTNGDLREELARVESFRGPRAGSRAIREDDSDGNGVSTFVLHAASRPAPRLEVRADAYYRNAALDAATRDLSARGGAVTVRWLYEPGWTAQATAGVSTTSDTDTDPAATWGIAVGSPRRHQWSATIAVSRTAAYYTMPMAANGILADEVELAVAGRMGRVWAIEAAAAAGAFESARSGIRNGRVSSRIRAARRISPLLTLAATARGFGFDIDADDGYFDPDFYGIAAVETVLLRETGSWAIEASLAPGLQRVGSGGGVEAAFHAAAGFDLLAGPGRSIGMDLVIANTGTQLSARPAGSYRYASLGLDIRWRFR